MDDNTTENVETSSEVEATEADAAAEVDPPETVNTDEENADTFSRSYVEKLRDENAKLRVRGQRADELAHRLHTELVRATGRLADPADLEFDPTRDADLLDDPEALNAAIEELLQQKPHLRSRKPIGDIGQGVRGTAKEPVNLLGILKNFA
ncbi:hypothetical protein A5724_08820 [Mycobacterium sp. ACS1612]|uniref:hypothetical protein n=1 Tax=Mycobacterium sp. ACS1612 TaxID=1834117 RepID=UPI0007FD200A|nr:hypothetical protein [Mycobacterium sp. ACS1612]OBF39231.1 hypothetical protein A5724_08820 [Mycobacterium sp. ACS1612]